MGKKPLIAKLNKLFSLWRKAVRENTLPGGDLTANDTS